jgi:hypothetical protein
LLINYIIFVPVRFIGEIDGSEETLHSFSVIAVEAADIGVKPGALASTLIRMSNTYREKREDGIHLQLKLTNTEMADLIGTSREGVNRMLNMLKDEGTISLVKGNIVIHRLADLRKMCKCPTFPACPTAICRL